MNNLEEVVEDFVNKMLKIEPQPVAIIQCGSSLTEDYVEGLSDIDFMVISNDADKVFDCTSLSNSVNIKSPKEFYKSAKGGDCFSLNALKFGKVHHGDVFINQLKTLDFKPNKRTAQVYMMSAVNNYGIAVENYFDSFMEMNEDKSFSQDSLEEYMIPIIDGSYKCARSCCKIIATEKTNEMYESFKDVNEAVSRIDNNMAEKLSFLYSARKNWRQNLEKLPAKNKIYQEDSGKYILEAEKIFREVFKKQGFSLPSFNDLIPENVKKVDSVLIMHNFRIGKKITYSFWYEDQSGKRDTIEESYSLDDKNL